MGTYREQDPLVEFMQAKHEGVLTSIRRVLAGEAPIRTLADERTLIEALAVAEATVLQPTFARVALRPDMARLLEDCQEDRVAQLAVLDALLHSRSVRIRKLRAAELIDLVQQHDERFAVLLLPVLRSQLPRTFYRALANAFAACLEGRPSNSNVSAATASADSPKAGLHASDA